MVRLKVVEKNEREYKMIEKNGKIIQLSIEFFDIEDAEQPEVNEYINISAELLNKNYKEYTTSFAFGKLDNICGKEDISLNDIDVIKIEKEDKEIYLKRLYG